MPSNTLPSKMQIAKNFAQIASMTLKYLVAGKFCSGVSKKENEYEFLCQNTRGPYVPRKRDKHPLLGECMKELSPTFF